jgi:Arc/MetJ-type ribon-helix-helix transcriptional regulator
MTITVRMDSETERLLRRLSRSRGANKSALIREAVRLLAEREEASRGSTAYDRLKDLIGAADSGGLNLSEDSHRKFAAMLKGKRSACSR